MILIMQWNARSLLANGLEFKGYVNQMKDKPDVICIQESWLKPGLDFVLKGYITVRRDREGGNGGGCVTFIRVGIPYRKVGMGETIEYVVVEIWDQGKKYVIINFYNPCKRLGFNELEKIEGQDVERVIWCGDFNAHNTLWGGTVVDVNGQVVEELIDARKLVCLNDGGGTRVNINSGLESALDLTLVSGVLGGITEWEILRECTMGSDHYPLVITILGNGKEIGNKKGATGRWIYEKANWAEFSRECEEGLSMMEGIESNCIDETKGLLQ
jgi:exonuclease III